MTHPACRRYRLGITLLLLLFPSLAAAQLDDRLITVTTPTDLGLRRQALVGFVWGPGGFPAGRMPAVTRDVPSPLGGLAGLARVDELRIGMDAGQEGTAFHFIPRQPIGRLVIVHNGHTCSLADYGVRELIDALLAARYSVLGVFMPGYGPHDCGVVSHDSLFAEQRYAPAAGTPMKYFLEPVAVSLNYLLARSEVDQFPLYREVSMVGLSGGGWTTAVYAAIDPRVHLSVQVAGSIPLYSRDGASVGDTEQTLGEFYRIAGYPDLYVLGAAGLRRKQVWILNRRDDCCFGARDDLFRDVAGRSWDEVVRGYEADVDGALRTLGRAGSFQLVIDEDARSHMISPSALEAILGELRATGRARPAGASPAR